jgi:hypothetical protein
VVVVIIITIIISTSHSLTFFIPSFLPSFLPFFLPSYFINPTTYLTDEKQRAQAVRELLPHPPGPVPAAHPSGVPVPTAAPFVR